MSLQNLPDIKEYHWDTSSSSPDGKEKQTILRCQGFFPLIKPRLTIVRCAGFSRLQNTMSHFKDKTNYSWLLLVQTT